MSKRDDEVLTLRRALRRVTEKNVTMFDNGFAAAVRMVEAGASVERLKDASGVPGLPFEDTHPVDMLDQEHMTGIGLAPRAQILFFDDEVTDVDIPLEAFQ